EVHGARSVARGCRSAGRSEPPSPSVDRGGRPMRLSASLSSLAVALAACGGSSDGDHNLLTDQMTPIYVGLPTTYAGYRLAPGSPGVGAASDGTNVGIH